jgi:biotin transport system substrate-specific component
MALCGAFAAFLTICAWISVPMGGISFTLQTFAVLLALGLLGGKWGGISILVYLLIGAMGVPVFSGFQGGFGVLFGATGGYLTGFLCSALVFWLITAIFPGKKGLSGAMLAVLPVCYLVGSCWYAWIYAPGTSFVSILSICVLPYIIPDVLKLALAFFLTQKLKRFV